MLGAATLVATTSGCGGSDAVKPAPDAKAAACTSLIARLPAQVLSRERTKLDVTGTAGWGTPQIVLRCGVSQLGPTTDYCIAADNVNWVFVQTKKAYTFTTFGRNPAVELTVPISIDRTTAPGALIDLAPAVRPLATTPAVCSGS